MTEKKVKNNSVGGEGFIKYHIYKGGGGNIVIVIPTLLVPPENINIILLGVKMKGKKGGNMLFVLCVD